VIIHRYQASNRAIRVQCRTSRRRRLLRVMRPISGCSRLPPRRRIRYRSIHRLSVIRRERFRSRRLSGPTEVVMANHNSTEFCYYISMVNTATITILRTWPPKSRSRRRPSRRRRRFGRPAVRDLADLLRRRSGSMPNIAVRFTSIENVPA